MKKSSKIQALSDIAWEAKQGLVHRSGWEIVLTWQCTDPAGTIIPMFRVLGADYEVAKQELVRWINND